MPQKNNSNFLFSKKINTNKQSPKPAAAVHTTKNIILNTLFPKRCPVCLSLLPSDQSVCPSCFEKLTFVRQPVCYRCGKPLFSQEAEYCFDCMRHPKSFDRNFSVFVYDKHMKFSMAQFKYHNKREFASFYVEQAMRLHGDVLCRLPLLAIVPVPIHDKKKKERGYNQAELLARCFSDVLHIPTCPNLLSRFVYTTPQKELSPRERLFNLSKAICVNPVFSEKMHLFDTVLLVDDIYTTGATLEACTRVLLRHGVQRVYTLCICIGANR